MNNPAQEGEPPSVGTWPADDTHHLWPHLPNLNHHEQCDIVLVFHRQSDHPLLAQSLPRWDLGAPG
eukprot:2254754-Pyramimonas_sp.AAC.1